MLCQLYRLENSLAKKVLLIGAKCHRAAQQARGIRRLFPVAGVEDVTDTGIRLDWDNCPYHTDSDKLTGWTKYNTELSYGTVDNKTVLDADDDVDPIQRFPRL